MPIHLNSAPCKFNNSAAIQELSNVKRLLCQLRSNVFNDLSDNLPTPSIDTNAAADLFFTTLITSTYLGISLNNQLYASKQIVTPLSNVTTYGIVYTYSKSIAGEPIVYTFNALINGNLSLALLLSNTDLSIYLNTNSPDILTTLDALDNHYSIIIGFLKKDLAKKQIVLDYFLNDLLDVSIVSPITENEVLTYSGCQWTNLNLLLNSGAIKDTAVNVDNLTDGDLLIWSDILQKWTNSSNVTVASTTDIQQITLAYNDGPLNETLLIPNNYHSIDTTNYGPNGLFNITTTQSGTYTVNWTGVVSANITTSIGMRISAIDPLNTLDIAQLESSTETVLSLTTLTPQSIAINYVITDVNTSTVFILQWASKSLLISPLSIVSGNFVINKYQ